MVQVSGVVLVTLGVVLLLHSIQLFGTIKGGRLNSGPGQIGLGATKLGKFGTSGIVSTSGLT